MDPSDVAQLVVILVLIGLSAFFSSAETSLTTCNRIHILSLAEEGSRKAKTLLKVVENSGKMLSTILIGNNIVNISASALMTTLTTEVLGSQAVGIGTGILTLLILIFGEITPKTVATVNPDRLALFYAPVIYGLMKLLTPVIFLVNKLSNGVLFLLRVDPNAKNRTMTENELRTIVDVSHEDGVIEKEEKQMIYNVFDFGDSQAKDVMVPRIDMCFLDVESSLEDLMKTIRKETYTRYPVFDGDIDNVIGVLNVKDLLMAEQKTPFCLRSLLREPYFTYEHKNTSELLLDMRQQSNNFAIVLDEYGATAGLITLEDLLEEIVGEIRDEYDGEEEEMLTELIPGREYRALGSAKLDDLNEILHTGLESEDYDSIGGYIIEQLDRLPVPGESAVTPDRIKLVVETVAKKRIEQVHIYLPEPKEESSEE